MDINVITVAKPTTFETGVGLVIGDLKPTYMSAQEARMLAFNLIGCADAADAEADFIAFVREVMKVDDARLAVSLENYRRRRRERREAVATPVST